MLSGLGSVFLILTMKINYGKHDEQLAFILNLLLAGYMLVCCCKKLKEDELYYDIKTL